MNIFDTTGFIARVHCGPSWTPNLILATTIPNIIVVACYLLITARAYVLFIYKDAEPENRFTFGLFILFVTICGAARFTEILAFWWPAYRFFVVIDWMCAISISALCFKSEYLLNYLLNFKAFRQRLTLTEQLDIENKKYAKAQSELQSANQSLTMTVDRLQYLIKSEVWLADKNQAVHELEALLKDIKK